MRLITRGHTIRVLDESLYRYRIREGSLSYGGDKAPEVAEAGLKMLRRIAETIPMTAGRRAALDVNVRASTNALHLAEMRRAIRKGDRTIARRHARHVAREDPGLRNIGVLAVTCLPPPAIRLILSATGRSPVDD